MSKFVDIHFEEVWLHFFLKKAKHELLCEKPDTILSLLKGGGDLNKTTRV